MTKSNFTAEDAKFMQQAIDLSIENVANGGGPFGAVIVRDGEVIATGTNRVTANCDPTAHAEVSAIRAACAKLGDFKLSGVQYTPRASLALCALAPSIGQAWSVYSTATQSKTPKR